MFRFFTVYGLWGRPDMALFKFVLAILNNKPIDIYNDDEMYRDFTYVDDLENVVTPNGLNGGYWVIRKAIEAIEKNKKYKVSILCEPQMGKRELYPTLSTKKTNKEVMLMMNFLSLCDGESSLLEISDILNIPIWDLYKIVEKLESHNLINVHE